MMFEVYVKTKKAIPGLAKILLIIILLGTIVFAWFVQKSKLAASELKLDKQTQIQTSAGTITFSLPSSWQKIDKTLLPDNILIGWRPSVNNKPNARIYVAHLKKSTITGKLRVISALNKLFPFQNAFVEPRYAKSSSLPACIGEGAAIFDREILSMYMRVMFLPDGSSFVITFIGDRTMANSFVLWDRQIAQTVKYFPDEQIKKVSAGQKISIGSVNFTLPNDSWIAKDKYFNLLTIQPAVTDSSKLWIANLKVMYLPKYRKSQELLIDHFVSLQTLDKTIVVHKVTANEKYNTYFAKDSDSITIDREKYEYAELCWLSRAKSGESVLISVNCEQNISESARADMRKALKTLNAVERNSEYEPKPINVVETISKYNPARQIGKIPGWYLISMDKKNIGFEALLCSTLSKNEQITLAGLDYTYFAGGTIKYTQREQWQISAKDFTGKYSSRMELRNSISQGRVAHLIIADSEISIDKIHTVVRIDDRINDKEFVRPKEFLPEGSALVLASMMAENSWTQSDTILISQIKMISAHIQTGIFKRVKYTDHTDIMVFADDELSYTTYKFDKTGRWTGIDIDTTIKLARTSGRKIALLYRTQAQEALRYFMQMEKHIK